MKKDNLFILIGPTAIGKTALSIELAKRFNGEIISADSMQIYKYMDIGSAKVTKEEMDGIPHYLLDIVAPDEEFTVAKYKRNAVELIKDINNRNKLPMVVGGTGLYINSLVYNLDFTEVPPNEEIRKELEDLANKYGNEYLHQELEKIDSKAASILSINDRQRMIRALEIYKITGVSKSDQNPNFREPVTDYNLVMIGLNMDRATLYERINKRVDIMLENGLIEEIKMLMDMGYNKDMVSMKGIGYKEMMMYLEGSISLEEAIEMIKKGSRNYAKRQLTWFRRDPRIHWVYVDEFESTDKIADHILEYSKDKFQY